MSGSCVCDEAKGEACGWCMPRNPSGIPYESIRARTGLMDGLGPQRVDGWITPPPGLAALPKHGEGVKQPREVSGKVRQMISDLPTKAVVSYEPVVKVPESEETLAEALCNPREVYSKADYGKGQFKPGTGAAETLLASEGSDISVPTLQLAGEHHAAYMEFRTAARELRAAGETLRKAQERYKAALERHSEAACKDEP